MRNVLVITYWDFEDALIQTYTLPYLRIMRAQLPEKSFIWLLTLDKNNYSANPERIKEAEARLLSDGIHWIRCSYKPFGLGAAFMLMKVLTRLIGIIVIKKIQVIHCWATPAGALGYILSLVTGKPLIIDSYEPHAESMVENGTWKKDDLAFRILFWFERKQTKRAFAVIAATEGMRNYALSTYDYVPLNFFVKPACVDLELFSSDKIKINQLVDQLNLKEKIVCVYAGKFGGIYLQDEVFSFLKVAHDYWGDKFRVLLLSSHSKEEIDQYCLSAGLDHSIIQLKFVTHSLVPEYLGLGDFAITPVKPVPTKRYCTPIKDGEYWALGLPVVIPFGISDDAEIIAEHNAGAILEKFDQLEFNKAVRTIDSILNSTHDDYRGRIRQIAKRYRNFAVAEKVYEKVYGNSLKHQS